MAIQDKFFPKRRKIAQAYKMLFDMNNPTARIVLQDMCAAHGVFDGGFHDDPYMHAFQAGERNSVLRILTLVKSSMEELIELSESEE